MADCHDPTWSDEKTPADCCGTEGSNEEWICMIADAELIEEISNTASEQGLSIGQFFALCCEQYEQP